MGFCFCSISLLFPCSHLASYILFIEICIIIDKTVTIVTDIKLAKSIIVSSCYPRDMNYVTHLFTIIASKSLHS